MPLQHNQEWDSNGNLVKEEWIEVAEDPVDPIMSSFVSTLTPEQQAALKKALGQ